VNLLLTLTGSGDVVGALHPHEGVHLYSKRLLNAECHIPRKFSLTVELTGQGGPGNLGRCSGRRHGEARRHDDLSPDKVTGWGGFFIGMAFAAFVLMIVC
jgi:hypothetical protein